MDGWMDKEREQGSSLYPNQKEIYELISTCTCRSFYTEMLKLVLLPSKVFKCIFLMFLTTNFALNLCFLLLYQRVFHSSVCWASHGYVEVVLHGRHEVPSFDCLEYTAASWLVEGEPATVRHF